MSNENLIEQNPKLVIENELGHSNSRSNNQLKYTSTDVMNKRKMVRSELRMVPTSQHIISNVTSNELRTRIQEIEVNSAEHGASAPLRKNAASVQEPTRR